MSKSIDKFNAAQHSAVSAADEASSSQISFTSSLNSSSSSSSSSSSIPTSSVSPMAPNVLIVTQEMLKEIVHLRDERYEVNSQEVQESKLYSSLLKAKPRELDLSRVLEFIGNQPVMLMMDIVNEFPHVKCLNLSNNSNYKHWNTLVDRIVVQPAEHTDNGYIYSNGWLPCKYITSCKMNGNNLSTELMERLNNAKPHESLLFIANQTLTEFDIPNDIILTIDISLTGSSSPVDFTWE